MRMRLTIAHLFAFILIAGIAMAALARPSELRAKVVYTATLTALLVGLLGAIIARGRSRAFWSGFALVGWSCIAIRIIPWLEPLGRASLLGPDALGELARLIYPIDTSKVVMLGDAQKVQELRQYFQETAFALLVLALALVGGLAGRHFHSSREGDRDSVPV
jgi:hypothetical protein